MAKPKRKRKKSASSSEVKTSKRGGFPTKYVIYGLAVLALAGAVYGFFSGQEQASAFAALAEEGRATLTKVKTHNNEGRNHVPPGTRISYGTNPPTSGSHFPTWVDPGFYETAKGRSNLVHSLEHGMIVFHYDAPGAEVLETLRDWTGLFNGPWSGIVAVKRAGLGEKLIFTAWRRTLRLDRFDAKAAAAFIDAYRGRGPENPVR
ncbi:MAG: DUF3105 domain-containing protein [Alphaproteobacteria bacterium]|nr:DUF3105 domain-containing protein [Alphaproteobacteria bacterium]